jgi:hypothetical protein
MVCVYDGKTDLLSDDVRCIMSFAEDEKDRKSEKGSMV